MISSMVPRFSPAALRTESPANVLAARTLRNFLSGSVFLILLVIIVSLPPHNLSLLFHTPISAILHSKRSGIELLGFSRKAKTNMTPEKPEPDPKLPEPDPDPADDVPDILPNPYAPG